MNEDPWESLKDVVIDESCFTPLDAPGGGPTEGTVWVNDGESTYMVPPTHIPEGMKLGRLSVHKDKEQFREQALNNNPNAKTYEITLTSGEKVVTVQLSKWARENGYKYRALKSLLIRCNRGMRRAGRAPSTEGIDFIRKIY